VHTETHGIFIYLCDGNYLSTVLWISKLQVDCFGKLGVVVGKCGYYSKVSGRKWVEPPQHKHHYH
jgi:hypothetical protein